MIEIVTKSKLVSLSAFLFDYLNALDEKEIKKALPSRLLDEKHTVEGWKSIFNRLNISATSIITSEPKLICFERNNVSIEIAKRAMKEIQSMDNFEDISNAIDKFSGLHFSLSLSKKIWEIFNEHEETYPKLIVISRKHNTQFNIKSEIGDPYWYINLLLPDLSIEDILEEYESVEDFKKEAMTQLKALIDFLQAENIEDYLE